MGEIVKYRLSFKTVSVGKMNYLRDQICKAIVGITKDSAISVGHFVVRGEEIQCDLWIQNVKDIRLTCLIENIKQLLCQIDLNVSIEIVPIREYVTKQSFQRLQDKQESYEKKTSRVLKGHIYITILIVLVVIIKICFGWQCKLSEPQKTTPETCFFIEKPCLPVQDTVVENYLRRIESKIDEMNVKFEQSQRKIVSRRNVSDSKKDIIIHNNLTIGGRCVEANSKNDSLKFK